LTKKMPAHNKSRWGEDSRILRRSCYQLGHLVLFLVVLFLISCWSCSSSAGSGNGVGSNVQVSDRDVVRSSGSGGFLLFTAGAGTEGGSAGIAGGRGTSCYSGSGPLP
jgi:hypothetical protein